MAHLNGTYFRIVGLSESDLVQILLEVSPPHDGTGLKLVLSLTEEMALFEAYDRVDEWLTHIVNAELSKQGRHVEKFLFQDQGGGIIVS